MRPDFLPLQQQQKPNALQQATKQLNPRYPPALHAPDASWLRQPFIIYSSIVILGVPTCGVQDPLGLASRA